MTITVPQLFESLKRKEWRLVTAESCTGGLIAQTITDEAGSSAFLDCGFVTYSNEAKIQHLGVRAETLEAYGAVSAETASEMALGALKNAPNAQVSISVTGIAGPGGGSTEKPVGLVYIGLAHSGDQVAVEKCHFEGNRQQIREQTRDKALDLLAEILEG